MLDVESLKWLLLLATLLPLVSFFVILCAYPRAGTALGSGSWIATGAILAAMVLSFTSLGIWLSTHWPSSHGGHSGREEEHHEEHVTVSDPARPGGSSETASPFSLVSFEKDKEEDESKHGGSGASSSDKGEEEKDKETHGHDDHHSATKPSYTGDYYLLGQFGDLRLTISYYIDTLTVCMFCMVTLIASCIHFYAIGYMQEELEPVTDHEVTLADGSHLKRPGRYFRFFQYLSLFCFSMLGLVLAGNIAMVFVFWELVGICSWFLIGFYVERKSASNAANKAFITNRVGDFGMIIGLMALWTGCGTFAFGDVEVDGKTQAGIFSQVRPHHEDEGDHDHPVEEQVAKLDEDHDHDHEHAHDADHALTVPEGMVLAGAHREILRIQRGSWEEHPDDPDLAFEESEAKIHSENQINEWREAGYGYWLLIIAGLGIFCGCVGKSAQFPLHVWLPDAMEGPTPVSALVHSATMVAAGVYLVGRFYPVFTPEVLLVIAIIGGITLFMAATIAITATDIKRVLAYSTVSQLGYMMLALGVGGWAAGLMHLITHAFFKSLLFMCSGSVIHAVHTNEMPQMGGLLKKMPVTAFTMLVGCLAIIGASVPTLAGLSGYYSKDAILEQAWWFKDINSSVPWAPVFFTLAAGGAVITAFYMFRMWFYTFLGEPRDAEKYDHAHESPPVMYVPLVILSVFAISVAWNPDPTWLGGLPSGVFAGIVCVLITGGAALWYRSRGASGASDDGHNGHHGDSHHADHGEDDGHGDGHDDHHHQTLPENMVYLPVVLSGILLVVAIMWASVEDLHSLTLGSLLEQARHPGTAPHLSGEALQQPVGQAELLTMAVPNEHYIHSPEFGADKVFVTIVAFGAGIVGVVLAGAFYWFKVLDPAEVQSQFKPVYRFLINKWWFDELYDFLFIRPSHVVAQVASNLDKRVLDRLIDSLAWITRKFSNTWDAVADRTIVDGLANLLASWTYNIGVTLRKVQRGHLREYVMFIVLGTVVVFVLISFL